MDQPELPPLSDSLETPLLLHDPDSGEVVDANPAAEALYGYSVAELRGRTPADLVAGGEWDEPPVRAARRAGEVTLEWQVERKHGERRWLSVRLQRTEIDGTPYVLAELRDITEFRTRTRRLQLLHRIIRHNLRNDMTIVMGNADWIRRVTDDDDLRERAARIETVAGEVGEMVDSVERIERFATSDATERRRTDVRAVLEAVADEYGDDHPAADIEVRGDDDVPIRADGELRVALENAVENAIEHHDGPTPGIVLEVAPHPRAGWATARVRDDGPPIPEMEINAVEGHDRSELNHGTGVGLFVMKWCAESLGGTLEIEATRGGNVVEFTLPLAQQQASDGDGVTV